jgi:hypothetical protein
MKKHLLSFKIFFAALLAIIALLGFTTADASTVTVNDNRTDHNNSSYPGRNIYYYSATATTSNNFGFATISSIKFISFSGNGTS